MESNGYSAGPLSAEPQKGSSCRIRIPRTVYRSVVGCVIGPFALLGKGPQDEPGNLLISTIENPHFYLENAGKNGRFGINSQTQDADPTNTSLAAQKQFIPRVHLNPRRGIPSIYLIAKEPRHVVSSSSAADPNTIRT